jgi:DNA-binding protein
MSQAYKKVKATQERPSDANEVRITKKKPLGNYARYVLSAFKERKATEVTLKQMGRNVDTIVSVAEIVKYRVKGLH